MIAPPSNDRPLSRLWLPDALRFPAALAVIAFHVLLTVQTHRPAGDGSTWWLGWLDYGGLVAVSLFFVLSGFGVHLGRARAQAAGRVAPWDFASFALRRFWRLYPAYLAALVLSVALGAGWAWWRDRAVTATLPSPADVVAHLFLVHSLSSHTAFGIVPAFWFVGVLAHLLLLYPVYLWLAARLGENGALLIALLVTLLFRSAVVNSVEPGEARVVWLTNAPGRWLEWVLGAWLAAKVVGRNGLSAKVGLPALLAIPIWIRCGERWDVGYEPILGILLTLSLWWGLTATFDLRSEMRSPARWAGDLSYSAYLVHQIFVPYVASALVPYAVPDAAFFALGFLGVAALTLPVAAALHRWVETPAMARSAA